MADEEEVDYEAWSEGEEEQAGVSMTDQAKDLYEGVGPSTSAPAHEAPQEAPQDCSTLHQHNLELQGRVEELDRRNQILMRNISSLFKTAQEEGRRKDAIIKELRMQQWQSAAQKPSQ